MKDDQQSFSDESEVRWLRRLAADVFDLYFDPDALVQSEKNVVSLTSPDLCFAQRLDCRTYFVQAQPQGGSRAPGTFQGADEEQFAFARSILQRLEISSDEIARQEIFREMGQTAQIDPLSLQVGSIEPAREIGNFLHVTRQVTGLPVWSSRLVMRLTADRRIDFLELHWPLIPDAVVREAQRLAFKISDGWKAPAIMEAEIESVEAGVVHTPAVGYFFDIHAAVRVIYRSLAPHIGRKPTYHLDRHGEPVLLRQTSELVHESAVEFRSPDERTTLR